jgi:hypothetical protein
MGIKLSDEKQSALLLALTRLYHNEFDEDLRSCLKTPSGRHAAAPGVLRQLLNEFQAQRVL